MPDTLILPIYFALFHIFFCPHSSCAQNSAPLTDDA